MNTEDLLSVYKKLDAKYNLKLANSLSLDDGFSEDFPVLYGTAHNKTFWLYEYGGDFVLSVEIPGKDHHNHWHPQSIEEAVYDLSSLMDGK